MVMDEAPVAEVPALQAVLRVLSRPGAAEVSISTPMGRKENEAGTKTYR